MIGRAGWACVNRFGDPVLETVRGYRSDSIAAFMEGMPRTWRWWREAHNWTCQRVTVSVAPSPTTPEDEG